MGDKLVELHVDDVNLKSPASFYEQYTNKTSPSVFRREFKQAVKNSERIVQKLKLSHTRSNTSEINKLKMWEKYYEFGKRILDALERFEKLPKTHERYSQMQENIRGRMDKFIKFHLKYSSFATERSLLELLAFYAGALEQKEIVHNGVRIVLGSEVALKLGLKKWNAMRRRTEKIRLV